VSAQPAGGQQVESVMTATAGAISVEELATGLAQPWGMAFLPDGRLLVTERNSGDLHILGLDGTLSDPVEGTPTVFAQGQGGLLDVALDPDFAENGYVYLSYAMPGPDGSAATALGRGRWADDRVEGFEVIFRQEPWITGPNHFGNRIAFGPEGHLFLALGERFQFDPAQDLSNHLGTVIRINRDGSIPADNPFVGQEDAEDEIWSYGHRNIEAAAIHPETGALWIAEMGPLGGDELNRPEAGKNYGWPVVSWGINYDGTEIPDPPTRPEFADAVKHWSPVISPSGMVFYTGDVFPVWTGSMFIGGLSAHDLVRVELADGAVASEERIPLGTRIRDVEQGPDGHLYVLTGMDDGSVWRITPLE
jgi:glucose/arabinose dehydrogenase